MTTSKQLEGVGDGNIRPGTLTITVGYESVTLDPSSSFEQFARDKAKMDDLISRFANSPSQRSGR